MLLTINGYSVNQGTGMKEQRRHQRVRFGIIQPLVRLGQRGSNGIGRLENLSLGGFMIRTDIPLKVGEVFGCEFSVFGSPLVDMSAVIVSRVGDRYSARFQAGPISELLIKDIILRALASGNATILSINEISGRRVMRVAGGLDGSLRSDFIHGLSKVGVDEIDLSDVTAINSDGLELCRLARDNYRVSIVRPSVCVQQQIDEVEENQRALPKAS